MSELKDRIKELRTSLNKTQKQFAEELDLTQNYIWLVESGKRTLSDKTMLKMCKQYSVNFEWLAIGKGDMRETGFNDTVAEICRAKGLNDEGIEIVRAFLELNDQDRQGVINFIQSIKKDRE